MVTPSNSLSKNKIIIKKNNNKSNHNNKKNHFNVEEKSIEISMELVIKNE